MTKRRIKKNARIRTGKQLRRIKLSADYAHNRRAVLYRGDCLDFLKKLPADSVNLTITSPPYCIGKEYEGADRIEDFIETHRKVLFEVYRVTSPGGSICWQIGYHVRKGSVIPLDYIVHEIVSAFPDMRLRNRIIWTYGHGLHCSARFSGRHEVILWYTKGDKYTFNLNAVRIPQKYPGKRYYKGPKKGKLSGNPRGKNPSDVWDIPNVKSNHIEKTGHPCQFPVELALKLIRSLTKKGQTVLDPFAGSGTTGVAAIDSDRRFLGAELLRKYQGIAARRIGKALQGKATYRPLGQLVTPPDPNSSVAKLPAHFKLAKDIRALKRK